MRYRKIRFYIQRGIVSLSCALNIGMAYFPLHAQITAPQDADTAVHHRYTISISGDWNDFAAWAARENIDVLEVFHPANIAVIRTSNRVFAEKIAKHSAVSYALPLNAQPREELPVPGNNLFVNGFLQAKRRFPAIDGSDIRISIKEMRFDSLDVDLRGRVLPSIAASDATSTHAAIIATLIGGAGNTDPGGAGGAPRSRLLSRDYGELLPDEDYDTQGVSIQNHAYGIDIENVYGQYARAYDLSTILYPKLLHVFSAGNSGALSAPDGDYAALPGFANLTGNFKMAKNILTVGAVDSIRERAFFSSRGPAYDGRIKPELMAFGYDGSSGAAALVSAAAALLQQAYLQRHDSLPDSELLRALLLNSADDAGRPGPDFEYGFGILNVDAALQTLDQQRFFRGELTPGSEETFHLQVPEKAARLKITLTWNDAPALPVVSKALRYDLDLRLKDPQEKNWLPWVLNTAAKADSLRLPARRGVDRLNNIEQITIDTPPSGNYSISVSGQLPTGTRQSFSLAYQMDTLGSFQWVFPVKNDPVVAGKDLLLYWQSNMSGAGTLEWKPLNSTTWFSIDSAVDLKTGYKRWQVPQAALEAQLRMRTGAGEFLSDTFMIAPELRMNLVFRCPDSLGLSWQYVSKSTVYQLFGLGVYGLEPLLVTADTFVVLQRDLYPQQRFAVAPMGAGQNAMGRRSAAPDIYLQGVDCYLKQFYAESVGDQIHVYLQLAGTYGIQAVQFEKWDGTAFIPLHLFTVPGDGSYYHADLQPVQGENIYRAIVFTGNGGQIVFDPVVVYIAGPKTWLVYPNPVAPGAALEIVAAPEEGDVFFLYNALGQRLLSLPLDDTHLTLPLPPLPEGCYFFETRQDGRRKWGGGLLLKK